MSKTSEAVVFCTDVSFALCNSDTYASQTLDEETCTCQLKSQPVLNLITTCSPLALAAHLPTIPVVFAASCFSGSSPAQRSALHGQETCVQLDSLAK